MNTVAIIEARMGSSRLPGKTLMDLAGKPLLERVIDRIKLASSINNVVVATSVNQQDDEIEQFCLGKGILCFRGSEKDVLQRVYDAAEKHKADIVVQCGADCPFYDPELIDLLVYIMKWGGYDYTANDMKLTFPEGIDAHVIKFNALKICAQEAKDSRERDDTPRFIWNNPERFTVFNLEALPESKLNRSDIRLTVDYQQDLDLAREIYKMLPDDFSTAELVDFLDSNPELIKINSNCEQHSAAYKR